MVLYPVFVSYQIFAFSVTSMLPPPLLLYFICLINVNTFLFALPPLPPSSLALLTDLSTFELFS